jgi:maltose alpha-D-glucosyltransferase/alpha-amylase
MPRRAQSPEWYKNAIMYGLDVGTYMDSDGDGVGDFQGLRSRLDYIASLGVTCLWILPCFPTPNKDNGYDIVDYYNVDRRLGTLGDFVAFMNDATSRGLHVMLDLVVHHSSNQHPWFQESRAERDSPKRDYYVWTDQPPEKSCAVLMFPDVQESIWTHDDEAGAWYLHQFYEFQPDLNIENHNLRDEIRYILELWIQLGASAFRVDAASHMLGDEALKPTADKQPHEFLRYLRDTAEAFDGSTVLLAEADVEPDELASYFGDGHEMHMLYNFLLDSYLFLAMARGSASPVIHAWDLLPDKPSIGQWVNFLRNLDELDLSHLSDDERQAVYKAFAPDPDMRIYERGIRRRLAPMLHGDRDRLELAYSLLMSMPGTPLIVYGDEIGMGEDLSLDQRQSVRTPMQWSGERNGGFSRAPEDKVVTPVIADGPFGYHKVNVVAQRRQRNSLLNWVQRVVQVRRQSPEFGWGTFKALDTGDDAVLAHRCDWEGGTVLAVHNLSNTEHCVEIAGRDDLPNPIFEIFTSRDDEAEELDLGNIQLEPYGYRWYRCGGIRL